MSQFKRTHCRIPGAAPGRMAVARGRRRGSEERVFMRYRFIWEEESSRGRVLYNVHKLNAAELYTLKNG